MIVDFAIAASALAIALLGMFSPDLPPKWKKVLAGAAGIAFVAAGARAIIDDHDKNFLKTALTSILIPTNRDFRKIEDEIDWEANKRKLDDGTCHHSADGNICFFWSKEDTSKEATLVFDREDLAEIYANVLQGAHTRRLIKDRFDHEYKPPANKDEEWDEDFVDKVGLLSTGICFSKKQSWDGADYNYDPRWGINLICGGATKNIPMKDLIVFHNGHSWNVFNTLDARIRTEFDVRSEKDIQANPRL